MFAKTYTAPDCCRTRSGISNGWGRGAILGAGAHVLPPQRRYQICIVEQFLRPHCELSKEIARVARECMEAFVSPRPTSFWTCAMVRLHEVTVKRHK